MNPTVTQRRSAGRAISGEFLGWHNRQGPGDVCTSTATGSSCISETSPWAFVVVGVVLLAAGIAGDLAVWRSQR